MLFYHGLAKVNAAKHLYFILILLLNSISIFAFQSDNDSLHTIKGGTNMLSESECYPETRHPCIPDTKTDDDLLFTEDGRGG